MNPSRHSGRGRLPSVLALGAFAATLQAQPSGVAFDYRSELKLPHPATVIARGDFTGDRVPDLLLAGQGHITLLQQGSTSFDWKMSDGPASDRTPFLALAGRLNGDSRDDLLLLCGPRPVTAEVYLGRAGKPPAHSSTVELSGDFQQAVIADIDGDTHADILLCGKKALGITVCSGNGRGAFTPGPVIFPEISVSQAAVARMDADALADIVLVDWLGNRLGVFPGFGGMHFGDPVLLPFEEEPVAFALADIDGDRHTDIVAGFGEHPGIVTLGGDGKGNYAGLGRGVLGAAPAKIRVGDVDGDARNDILLSLPGNNSIVVSSGAGGTQAERSYSPGSAATDVVFFQDARRRYLNAAVLSAEEGVVRILHNRSAELPASEGWTFATTGDPADIEISDLNDDGWADIALTHASEPFLNLFLNNGRGNLTGQSSLRLPSAVTAIMPVASVPGGKDFLGTVPGGGSLACLSVSSSDLAVSPLFVKGDGALEPIDGRPMEGNAGRRVYALGEGRGGVGAAIYTYDIADRARYGETDTPLGLTGRLAASAVSDVDGDGLKDLVLLTAPDTGAVYTLAVYRQTDDGFAPERSIPLDLGSARSTDILIWIADLDGDLAGDLVINSGKPDNTLAVAMAGRGDAPLGRVVTVLQDVRIPSRKSLTATDFDADGRIDLVFVNEQTRTVQFLPGDGAGGYVGPVNLMSARGVSGFGVADINRDRENELILAIADEGILSVTTFHHPLFERKAPGRRE